MQITPSSSITFEQAKDDLQTHAGNTEKSWGNVTQVLKDSYNKVSFRERCSAWAKELTTSRADRSWSDWGKLLIGKISWLQGDDGTSRNSGAGRSVFDTFPQESVGSQDGNNGILRSGINNRADSHRISITAATLNSLGRSDEGAAGYPMSEANPVDTGATAKRSVSEPLSSDRRSFGDGRSVQSSPPIATLLTRANSTPDFTAAQRKEIFGENPGAEARERSMRGIEGRFNQLNDEVQRHKKNLESDGGEKSLRFALKQAEASKESASRLGRGGTAGVSAKIQELEQKLKPLDAARQARGKFIEENFAKHPTFFQGIGYELKKKQGVSQ